MAIIPESRQHVVGFDAARWLKEWAEHGGIVLLTHDRLHLRRLADLPLTSGRRLDAMRDAVLNAGTAILIAEHLRRQREGHLP